MTSIGMGDVKSGLLAVGRDLVLRMWQAGGLSVFGQRGVAGREQCSGGGTNMV